MMKEIVFYLSVLILALSLSSCGGKSESDKTNLSKAHESENVTMGDATHRSDSETSAKPTVIDFYATWCGPCKQIAPMFEMLKSEYSDKINFESVDVDKDVEMTVKYGIEAMPTFVILDAAGNEINRIVGADAKALSDAIDALSTI